MWCQTRTKKVLTFKNKLFLNFNNLKVKKQKDLFFSHDQDQGRPSSTNMGQPLLTSTSKSNEGQKKIESIVSNLKEKIHQESDQNLSSHENPGGSEVDEFRQRKYITKLDLIMHSDRLQHQSAQQNLPHPAPSTSCPILQSHQHFENQAHQRTPLQDQEMSPINEGFQTETKSYSEKGLDLTRTKWSQEMHHWHQPQQKLPGEIPNWHQLHHSGPGEIPYWHQPHHKGQRDMPNWHQPHQEQFESHLMYRQHHNSCPSTHLGQWMFQSHLVEGVYFTKQFYSDCSKKLNRFGFIFFTKIAKQP